MSRVFLYVAATCIATTAAAQQPGAPAPAHDRPAPVYDSAFDSYRAFQEQSVTDWRAVNEDVARIGGHVGTVGGAGHRASPVTKEPSEPAASGQSPERMAPEAPGGGHAGHH